MPCFSERGFLKAIFTQLKPEKVSMVNEYIYIYIYIYVLYIEYIYVIYISYIYNTMSYTFAFSSRFSLIYHTYYILTFVYIYIYI